MIKICGQDVVIEGKLLRIAHIDGDKYNCPQDPEATLAALRACGKRIDIFTFLQKLPDSGPQYKYSMEQDNLAVLSITSFEHWWNHQLRSVARNRARQAEKRGVVFRVVPFGDALVQGICDIYNESPIRLGKKFPHYGMTLEQGRKYAGTFPDRSTYIGAFVGEVMVGFIKLVTDQARTSACLIHILSMTQHREKAITNALIGQAVRFCEQQGIRYLVYENFAYGNKQQDSLSHFKETNGFQRFDLPRYYIPLTTVGRIALQFGLHRRLVDRFPEPMVAKLREFRTAWYSRRFHAAKEAS